MALHMEEIPVTTTYDITTDTGKVRLNIGDKDIADAIFTDEEIAIFLLEGSVDLASAVALEAWAATYAANASQEKIGDYSYTQKIVENMLKLAQAFRDKAAGLPFSTWGVFDFTGKTT